MTAGRRARAHQSVARGARSRKPQKITYLLCAFSAATEPYPRRRVGAAAAKLGVVGVEERLAARPRRRRRARADEVADLGDDLGGLVLRGGPVLVLLVRVEQRVAEDAAELPRMGVRGA